MDPLHEFLQTATYPQLPGIASPIPSPAAYILFFLPLHSSGIVRYYLDTVDSSSSNQGSELGAKFSA